MCTRLNSAQALNRELALLKEDALNAMTNARPAALEEALSTYLAVLFAFPAAWSRYGKTFGNAEAGVGGALGFGKLDHVFSDLHDLAVTSLGSPIPHCSGEFTFLATRISERAMKMSADALIQRALTLPLWVYAVAAPDRLHKASAVESAWGHLIEAGTFVFEPVLTDSLSPEKSRLAAARGMRSLYLQISELMKIAIDLKDLTTLADVDRAWGRMLSTWERASAINEELAGVKESLDGLRETLSFGLAMWAHRKVVRFGAAEWTPTFDQVSAAFRSARSLERAAGRVLESDPRLNGPWDGWTLRELGEGAHWGGSGNDFLRLIADLMLRIEPTQGAYALRPSPWVRGNHADLQAVLAQEPHVDLPADILEARREALGQSIANAAAAHEQNEKIALANAPASAEKLAEFGGNIRGGWLSRRVVARLFEVVERYQRLNETPPVGDNFFGFDEWLEKEWFTEPPRIDGMNMARPLGENLGESELRWFLATVSAGEVIDGGDDPVERLRTAVRDFRANGYDPTIILFPLEWRLVRQFGLTERDALIPDVEGLWNAFEGIPVLRTREGPRGQVLLLDLRRYGRWRQWLLGEPDGLRMTFRQFGTEEARTTLRDHPTLFSEAGSDDTRLIELQTRVLLGVRERFEIVADDQRAARWIRLEDRRSGPPPDPD